MFMFVFPARLRGADFPTVWLLREPPLPLGPRPSKQHLQYFTSPHDRHCLCLILFIFSKAKPQHQLIFLNWNCLIFFMKISIKHLSNFSFTILVHFTKSLNHSMALKCKNVTFEVQNVSKSISPWIFKCCHVLEALVWLWTHSFGDSWCISFFLFIKVIVIFFFLRETWGVIALRTRKKCEVCTDLSVKSSILWYNAEIETSFSLLLLFHGQVESLYSLQSKVS